MKKSLFILYFISSCIIITHAQPFQTGNTYVGAQDYIEYRAGNLPIIITAPHGGRLEPTAILDRNCATCTTVMDANTMELAYQIDTALRQVFGCFPNIIVNKLHRKKLDTNREILEAANGSAEAEKAWHEWHQFIQAAKNDVVKRYGRGILIDIHGHGHTIQRLEIGYLLDDPDLRLSDSIISTPLYRDRVSIKNLVLNNLNGFNTAQLIRGTFALGTLLAAKNFPAVPSQQDIAPKLGEDYFNGGYNTLRHGSRDSTKIDAIQIECNLTGVRNTYDNRNRFATELANVLKVYLGKHYFTTTNFGCQTATKEINPLDIQIFPNPTHNAIYIKTETLSKSLVNATLYDMKGLVIVKKILTFNNQQAILELPNPLSIGMYILTLSDENRGLIKQTKILIE